MSLSEALLNQINNVWVAEEGTNQDSYLVGANIHPDLAKAIENSGDNVPKELNPNTFNNYEVDAGYPEIWINVKNGQKELITFVYE